MESSKLIEQIAAEYHAMIKRIALSHESSPSLVDELIQDRLSTTQLSLGACAIAGVFGLIGTAIRYRAGRPPALSPVVDVGILALVSLALIGYRRRVKTELAKLEYLKRAFAPDAPVGLEERR